SWQWVGGNCGRHGSYVFYKAFRYHISTEERILALGEFFFVQCRPEDPVCVGELQLLWHDKHSGQDLASTRLYYLPDTTPAGRTSQHGEDEMLAVSEKIVMRTTDLASWLVEPEEWNYGSPLLLTPKPPNGGVIQPTTPPLHRYSLLHSSVNMQDVLMERKALNTSRHKAEVLMLSVSAYCRHKALMKRIEGTERDWLERPGAGLMLAALGIFTSDNPRARVVFCRDTFDYPQLFEHDLICEELGKCH
uniref:BAH domain-containing protein n=1 Tax=Ciona intestinalis TaxID=7719 RepID=F6ZGN5_CIOIN